MTWISTKDRLPNDDSKKIIRTDNGHTFLAEWQHCEWYIKNILTYPYLDELNEEELEKYYDTLCDFDYWNNTDVEYWCEIPELIQIADKEPPNDYVYIKTYKDYEEIETIAEVIYRYTEEGKFKDRCFSVYNYLCEDDSTYLHEYWDFDDVMYWAAIPEFKDDNN